MHGYGTGPRGGGRCQYNENEETKKDGAILSDLGLDRFVGADGLMELLILVDEGRLPKNEVIEMIKRLHIPGYEEARRSFHSAIQEGVFEPNTPLGFYSQSEIKATLEYAERQG